MILHWLVKYDFHNTRYCIIILFPRYLVWPLNNNDLIIMEKLPAIPVALYHSHHKFWKCGSKIFVLTVGLSSKLFFRFFHDVNIGPNQFQLDHLIKKYETRSVITVSNHMRYEP